MSNQHGDPGHGDSPAAWTAVVVMLIGIAAGTVFFFLQMPTFVWVCVGVVALGLILGAILAKAGYGVKGPRFTPKSHD
ncbi:DUF6704 family protein [Leucobacter komagatae]|uniref:Mambrane protein n=1 Tax=Leucobacter komagatae TaxID=55969 RepID=A0A0D0H5P0_9MICO|nr:DUF6704 family protein [Leucobacter komagatae]KIP52445.1 hypothetical protein SD72_09540 [Leucobacter komagatae]